MRALSSRPRLRAAVPLACGVALLTCAQVLITLPSTTAAPTTGLSTTANDPVPGDLVDQLSNATTSTYEEPDGSFQSVLYTSPVNYEASAGAWEPIDNTLVPAAGEQWAATNAANDYQVLVPLDASQTPLKVVDDGQWVTFRLRGADGAPSVNDSEATFTDVNNAAEVSYEASGAGVKESIVLDRAPQQPVSYVFDVDVTDGLTPRLTDDGGLEVRDADGKVHFSVPAPFMVDSAAQAELSEAVGYELARAAEGWVLTVTPDQGWLTDPARVYPVVIDPTIIASPASTDCWIGSGDPNTSFCGASATWMRVGANSSGDRRRAIVKFNTSAIPDTAVVAEADLALYLDATQTTNVRLANYTVRQPGKQWNNQATWNSPDGVDTWAGGGPGGDDYSTTELSGQTSGYKHWHPSDLVDEWITGYRENRGFLVKQETEEVDSTIYFTSSAAGNDPARWPKLTVEYLDLARSPVPEVDNAMAHVMFACMVQHGEVPASASISGTLTTVAIDGTWQVPANPVAPSDGCIISATDSVYSIIMNNEDETARTEELTTLTEAVDQGQTVAKAPGDLSIEKPDAIADNDDDPARCPMPTLNVFLDNANRLEDMSAAWYGFPILAAAQSPCYFNWSTNFCNRSPDSVPFVYDFHGPCRKHDFGYRNMRKANGHYNLNMWRDHNKAVADWTFLRDMTHHCTSRHSILNPKRRWCLDAASAYYGAVCAYRNGAGFTCGQSPRYFTRP